MSFTFPLTPFVSILHSHPAALSLHKHTTCGTGAFWYAWQTILIVLLILIGGSWWLWRLALYVRKKAAAPMDLELLLYGLLAAVDVLSATLVLVLLMVRCVSGRISGAC